MGDFAKWRAKSFVSTPLGKFAQCPSSENPDMQDSITRTWELTCEEMLRALADIDEMTRKLRRELL